MKKDNVTDYFEVSHTADLALRVIGKDIFDLLRSAEKGMYALIGLIDDIRHVKELNFTLPYLDDESLLINYLNELLYYVSTGVAPRLIDIVVEQKHVKFSTNAAEVLQRTHEIKAATFHDISLNTIKNGLEAVIVFDV